MKFSEEKLFFYWQCLNYMARVTVASFCRNNSVSMASNILVKLVIFLSEKRILKFLQKSEVKVGSRFEKSCLLDLQINVTEILGHLFNQI